jgi:hypothetical protein
MPANNNAHYMDRLLAAAPVIQAVRSPATYCQDFPFQQRTQDAHPAREVRLELLTVERRENTGYGVVRLYPIS